MGKTAVEKYIEEEEKKGRFSFLQKFGSIQAEIILFTVIIFVIVAFLTIGYKTNSEGGDDYFAGWNPFDSQKAEYSDKYEPELVEEDPLQIFDQAIPFSQIGETGEEHIYVIGKTYFNLDSTYGEEEIDTDQSYDPDDMYNPLIIRSLGGRYWIQPRTKPIEGVYDGYDKDDHYPIKYDEVYIFELRYLEAGSPNTDRMANNQFDETIQQEEQQKFTGYALEKVYNIPTERRSKIPYPPKKLLNIEIINPNVTLQTPCDPLELDLKLTNTGSIPISYVDIMSESKEEEKYSLFLTSSLPFLRLSEAGKLTLQNFGVIEPGETKEAKLTLFGENIHDDYYTGEIGKSPQIVVLWGEIKYFQFDYVNSPLRGSSSSDNERLPNDAASALKLADLAQSTSSVVANITFEKTVCPGVWESYYHYHKMNICEADLAEYSEQCATYVPPVSYYDSKMISKCQQSPNDPVCATYEAPMTYEEYWQLVRYTK